MAIRNRLNISSLYLDLQDTEYSNGVMNVARLFAHMCLRLPGAESFIGLQVIGDAQRNSI
jgi:hypothetical protein